MTRQECIEARTVGDSSNSSKDSQCFDELHRGLTVEMIATPRAGIKTCSKDESVLDVMNRIPKPECYDYLPVTDGERDRIIGVFHAKPLYCCNALRTDTVSGERICALSEDQLIGASTSILDFVKEGDQKPWRLIVSDAGITGLVTLVDLLLWWIFSGRRLGSHCSHLSPHSRAA